MKLSTRLVERYIAAAIIPYALLALLLLTAVLVAQQGSRFAELLGQVQAPLAFVVEITISIIPGLLLFTIPMSVLAGTLIGFSRLGSDSELTALRAAGAGTQRLLSAPLLIGLLASLTTLYLGIFFTPIAAGRLRDATLRAALSRLKSPIQPGALSNIGNKVIYVREGDDARGEWHGVLVFSEEANERGVLVTAERGRLDSSNDVAELVLYDTVASTFRLPRGEGEREKSVAGTSSNSEQLVTERSAYLRVKLDEKLGALIESLRARKPELDELAWDQLVPIARSDSDMKRRRAAQIVFHKKLALGVAPFCFAFLGAAAGLRVKRGGRGIGVLISLGLMLLYYLVALAGEQMAKTSVLPIPLGMWLASALTFLAAIVLLLMPLLSSFYRKRQLSNASANSYNLNFIAPATRHTTYSVHNLSNLTNALFGLLDRTIFSSLVINFIFALCALTSVFLIFTLFELWRHISANNVGWWVVTEYFLFLCPFVIVSLSSVSILVSTIFSYAVLARRSEAIAWLASGQSIYRLLLPGLLLAFIVGGAVWITQDNLLPSANRRQDTLRSQIRGGLARAAAPGGRQWSVSPDGTYLFSYQKAAGKGIYTPIQLPLIFAYSVPKGVRISHVISSSEGVLQGDTLTLSDAYISNLEGMKNQAEREEWVKDFSLSLPPDIFEVVPPKLTHLESRELEKIARKSSYSSSDGLKAQLALETRKVEAVAPVVMVLLAMPLAIAFGRRSALVSLCAAVLAGVAFWGVSSGLELLGSYGLLSVGAATWGTSIIFTVLGFYLLTRTRT